MAATTTDLSFFDVQTDNIYEAVLIIAKRARAITAERKAKEVLQDNYDSSEEVAEFDEIEYEDVEKAVVVAMNDFFDKRLEVSYRSDEDYEIEA